MKEQVEIPAPPMWKSFLVGMLLLSLVLAPLMGMVFYFSPIATRMGWYVGTALAVGFVVGLGISAGLSAVFAKKASG